MRPHHYKIENKIELFLAFVTLIAALCLAFGDETAAAQAKGVLTPQEKRGKQIYRKGEDGTSREITAVLGSDNLELPASSFTCANCHGLRGEGKAEGGLLPPPVNWETLTQPHTSALTRRERVPYTEATVTRAISAGFDPSGTRLHPGMPKYSLTREQMTDLVAYLEKLGTEADTEPGLSETTIKVGAALPMSGTLSVIGEDVRAALSAYFADVNSRGGIYGRSFELVVEDSKGNAAGTAEATRRLVEQDGVFALVGSFEPKGSETSNEFLKQSEVPLVGPITLSPPSPTVPNRYVFYLIPTFSNQARTLVDFVGSDERRSKEGTAPRLAVVYANNDFDQDALAGLKAQATMYSMQIVAEQGYAAGHLSPAVLVTSLASKKPDYIFFFGNGDDFTAFAAEMYRAKLNASLLSSAVMIGRGAFGLPVDIAARTYLSYPLSLQNPDDFAEFIGVMQGAGVNLRSAFQPVAFAAAKIFVEATKLSGRQLDRAALISGLEKLRDFKTGVVPPVTFGPNRRVGAEGSYIVRVDMSKKQYVPMGERLVPRDKP